MVRIERATATRARLLATAANEAPAAFPEERVGLGRGDGDLAEDGFEVALAFAGVADLGSWPGLDGRGALPRRPGAPEWGTGPVETDLCDKVGSGSGRTLSLLCRRKRRHT